MGKLEQLLLKRILAIVDDEEARIPQVVLFIVERAQIHDKDRRHDLRCSLERLAREEVKKKK